ncbi:hypothetical protein [uncultured Aquimarina sp.]|uniref:hypothetical protein n=1 Tax=uncultured Aquimarina sp. TaxID=575652 RepID=UPI00260947A3|nr:hypothetical protein [uncultured Aquimarina sp.]
MFVQNESDRDSSTKTIDKIVVVIKTIVYIIAGFLVYPFLVLGEKREDFVSNTVSNYIGIFLVTFYLYFFVYLLIGKRVKKAEGYSSIIGFVIAIIFFQFYSMRDVAKKIVKAPEKDKIEKYQVPSVSIPKSSIDSCKNVKYGIFYSYGDTIRRYRRRNRDYEEHIRYGEKNTYRIKWISECNYYTLLEGGMLVRNVYIGNFEYGEHELYYNPITEGDLRKVKVIKQRLTNLKSREK